MNDTNLQRPGEPLKKRTIAKELSYLSSMLGWAYRSGHTPKRIPFENFPSKRPPKKQILAPEELSAFIDQLDKHHRLAVLLMSDTGLRQKEALNMTVEQVDLTNDMLLVKAGKGEKDRDVPIMTDRLRYELKKRILQLQTEPVPGNYLVVNPVTKKPYLAIRKALFGEAKRAKIKKHVTHHMLRHTFGTIACMAEMLMRAVQSIMGHANIKTTEGYVHLADQILKKEANKFSRLVEPVGRKRRQASDNMIEFRMKA